MDPASFPYFPRRLGLTFLATTGLVLTACGDSTAWREVRAVRPSEYEMQAIRGFERPAPVLVRSDSIWVVTRSMVLRSTDRGRTWSKRFVAGTPALERSIPVFRVGAQLWTATECGVTRLGDDRDSWQISTLPGCDPKVHRIGGLLASPNGGTWAWTYDRLFELGPDGRPTGVLKESGADTIALQDFAASDRVLWLIDNLHNLFTASPDQPTAWRNHGAVLKGWVELLTASADTLWLTQAGESTRQVLTRLVLAPDGSLRIVDDEKVDDFANWVEGGGYNWMSELSGNRVFRRLRKGEWDTISVFEADAEVTAEDGRTLVALETGRIRVFGGDGKKVLGELSDREGGEVCAVQQRGQRLYAFTEEGTVLRMDSTFFWHPEFRPGIPFSRLRS
jgi:hypothetical protein